MEVAKSCWLAVVAVVGRAPFCQSQRSQLHGRLVGILAPAGPVKQAGRGRSSQQAYEGGIGMPWASQVPSHRQVGRKEESQKSDVDVELSASCSRVNLFSGRETLAPSF